MASSMSLQDIRDFVRNSLDVDDTELTDVLLDRFIRDASNRVENFSTQWSFRAVTYPITTVVGQQEYVINDDDNAALTTGITYPLQRITSVIGPTWELSGRDHAKMRRAYAGTSRTGTPAEYSVWGDGLFLWPTPSTAATIQIDGYRRGADWITGNASVDFPDDLHEVIALWALNRAYAQQDLIDVAEFYRDEFVAELGHRAKRYITGLDSEPLVVNGGTRSGQWRASRALGPLRYDWE